MNRYTQDANGWGDSTPARTIHATALTTRRWPRPEPEPDRDDSDCDTDRNEP